MKKQQSGFFLIEALIAILIFSLGILGMVGMGGTAIAALTDARFRTDAANLANDLASHIQLNVNRANGVALQTSLAGFQHQATINGYCSFAGTAGNADVAAWDTRVRTTGPNLPGLPGTTPATQQVLIDMTPTGYNRVQITICWQGPTDTALRRHTLVTYVN